MLAAQEIAAAVNAAFALNTRQIPLGPNGTSAFAVSAASQTGDDGGARWAAVASLVETCKLHGVDPQRYFTEVLTRLVNGWMESRIDELMPWHWAASKTS